MASTTLEERFVRYRTHADMRALGSVFDEVAPEMLSVARHLTPSATDAEDLVQSTFLAVLKDAGSFDATRRLRPWLLGVLANHARRARERSGREVEPDRLERAEPSDPLDEASATELQGAVEHALADCPPKYARVLRLHLAEGLRPREMAQELALEPGTVRVHLHRGLKLLRDALPAGFAYGAAATVTAGRGLAAVRQSVLSEGARQAGVSASAAPPSYAAAKLAVAVGGLTVVLAGVSSLLFEKDDEAQDPASPDPIAREEMTGSSVAPEIVPRTVEAAETVADEPDLETPWRDPRRTALEEEVRAPGLWSLFETEHYLVIASVRDEATVQELLVRLESIHSVYVADFPPARFRDGGEPREKAVVRFCADAEQYVAYNAPSGSAAYWSERERELVLFASEELRTTWMTLFHEGWHQYAFRLCGHLAADTWFGEGIGDHYSGYRYAGMSLVFEPNAWRVETLSKMLAEERYAPLEELVGWGTKEYFGQNKYALGAGESFAQGWSLAEFLRLGADGERAEILELYLEALATSGKKDVARDQAFSGVDWKALEAAWRAHWSR